MNTNEAIKLAQKWQQTDWNTESPVSADFAVSEANDVISALINALREALAEQPAQQEPDYAWPTVADYEREVWEGAKANDAFRAGWNMARTTNDLFKQMGGT